MAQVGRGGDQTVGGIGGTYLYQGQNCGYGTNGSSVFGGNGIISCCSLGCNIGAGGGGWFVLCLKLNELYCFLQLMIVNSAN